MTTDRTADYPVDPAFPARWSPRAFDRSAIDAETLLTLFEAARWAPSAYNYQPWRFAYATRDSDGWNGFVDALLPFNAAWAQHASALVFVLSDTQIVPPGGSTAQPATTNSFDAGAAWALLALQAHKLDLHTHAMAGFDAAKAAALLGTGDRFKVEAAVAIGRLGDPEELPEALRAREVPSPRKAVSEIAFRDRLPEPA